MNILSQSSNVGASSINDTHIKTSCVSNLEDDLLIFLIKFYVLKPFHIIFYKDEYIRLFAIIPWNVKSPSVSHHPKWVQNIHHASIIGNFHKTKMSTNWCTIFQHEITSIIVKLVATTFVDAKWSKHSSNHC
jgi:hypothetical protein